MTLGSLQIQNLYTKESILLFFHLLQVFLVVLTPFLDSNYFLILFLLQALFYFLNSFSVFIRELFMQADWFISYLPCFFLSGIVCIWAFIISFQHFLNWFPSGFSCMEPFIFILLLEISFSEV